MDSVQFMMHRDELLGHWHRGAVRFGELAEHADLETPVPGCPGWSLADLVHHQATNFDFWARVVHEHLTDVEGVAMLPRAHQAELVDSYWAAVDRLEVALRHAEPQTPVWTWSGDHSAAFVLRRMTHETAVHGWDAATTVGADGEIDAALASDGIDEFLTHFQAVAAGADDPSVHLHCTDADGEWTVRPANGELVVTREHAKGEVAIRGAAGDLLLLLWGRIPLDSLDVIGEPVRADLFLSRYHRPDDTGDPR